MRLAGYGHGWLEELYLVSLVVLPEREGRSSLSNWSDVDSGFFEHLPANGIFERLAGFDKSSETRVHALWP